jgi:hypothetical protein
VVEQSNGLKLVVQREPFEILSRKCQTFALQQLITGLRDEWKVLNHSQYRADHLQSRWTARWAARWEVWWAVAFCMGATAARPSKTRHRQSELET